MSETKPTALEQIGPQTSEPSAPFYKRAAPDLSIVVPLYNEEATLEHLVEQIHAALPGQDIEILFIDDGSRDGSWQRIRSLAQDSAKRVVGYRHRRNFGKAEALATGFSRARGRIVVTLDADLQDDPSEIPALLAKIDQGYDLVSGWKQRRQDPLSKTIPSRVFNLCARAVSGIKLHDFNCGLKAYRSEAIQDLDLYGELHRFIPILVQAEGFQVTELPVKHHPREHGKSKYGWGRIAKGFLDLLSVTVMTRYLRRPGHFFGGLGLLTGLFGFGVLSYLSFMKLFYGEGINDRPLFFLGIMATLFGGQLISTGIIGEFLLRQNRSRNGQEKRFKDVISTNESR